MSQRIEQLSQRTYEGIWGVLVRWFKVPRLPPTLPSSAGEAVESFQPAAGFLRYLKFQFWLLLLIVDIAILIVWIAITVANPIVGAVLFVPALILAVVPDVIVYLALHLRYDTTWYVMTDRSVRMRRGVWIIHETTITFENVQNVTVRQGPLQRYFGISDVMIETAGGGGGQGPHGGGSSHTGLIEGVADAARIRDLLLSRLQQSRTAGLGDEDDKAKSMKSPTNLWTPRHVQALREVRDAVRMAIKPPTT